MALRSEQEQFWAGDFGSQYISRNQDDILLNSNIELFSKITNSMTNFNSAIEFGANIGLNLKALKKLYPEMELSAVEINKDAAIELNKNPWIEVHNQSILEFVPQKKYDLAFTKGVLIHINPDHLDKVYTLLYEAAKKYILVAEYYNTTPTEIDYRGHRNKLFKRDFAGEILDKYQDLKLIDYGFLYHRDACSDNDDTTWFLLEKQSSI